MPQAEGPGPGPARAAPRAPGGGRTSRREFLALGLGAGAAAALAACSAGERAQPEGGASGRLADSVTLGVLTITDTLDPHGTLSYSQFMAHRQIYDTLVTFDDRG